MNRLAAEKSLYLRQHAGNPVDWFPWGPEALAAARSRAVPLFLSIGYSSCHWCHVMERESFEDAEVARLLNAGFVAVKVDREELPAVDHLYMAFCQGVTGSGGWPLTIFATPEAKPFHAGTYFPRESHFGRPGLLDLLPRIAGLWAERREEVLRTAAGLCRALEGQLLPTPGPLPGEGLVEEAWEGLARLYDSRYGGFGSRPKFPTVPWLLFLLERAKRGGDGRARAMLEQTLRAMRLGGIFDHLGYGFHRYSTDREWLLPHFEKTLYDQALLALAYAEAFALWGEPGFRRTAEEVLAYVRRELAAPDGGFAAAEDADSEGEEGRFYLWTTEEAAAALGAEAEEFTAAFHMRANGNFTSETGERSAGNILHRLSPLAVSASDFVLPAEGLPPALEAGREKLLRARARRPRPQRDDAVLADWNGLMIAALARAAAVFGDPDHAAAAAAAAEFVLARLRDPSGNLLHRWREGEAGVAGSLDDHAFLAWGCLELHAATGGERWLAEGERLAAGMGERFRAPGGAYFFSAADPLLPLRQAIAADAAVPSGNAVAVRVLLRLAGLTRQRRFAEEARALLAGVGGDVARDPLGCAGLLTAAMQLEEGGP